MAALLLNKKQTIKKLKEGIKKKLQKVKKHNENPFLCSESYLCRCIWSEMHGACCLGVGGREGHGFWRESLCVESLELRDSARTPAA